MAHEWDLAQYTDLGGTLGKTIPPGQILIPGLIWLEGEHLAWNLASNAKHEPKSRNPARDLLNRFVKLWKSSDERILAFARENGVLHVAGGVERRERLEEWRRLSRKACALLTIGAQLRLEKKQIDRDEWRWVQLYSEDMLTRLSMPGSARFELAREISGPWLRGSRFSMQWSSKRKRFGLEIDFQGEMLNAMGLQLALTIANADSLYICSGCALPYPRSKDKRQPKTGQSNFCDECGTTVARQQADRRRKLKMAEVRRLYAAGVEFTEISKRTATRISTVRSWCTT